MKSQRPALSSGVRVSSWDLSVRLVLLQRGLQSFVFLVLLLQQLSQRVPTASQQDTVLLQSLQQRRAHLVGRPEHNAARWFE